MIKNEYRYKLHELWKLSGSEQTFLDWLIDETERNHNKQIKMSGDLGEAFSRISELESKLKLLGIPDVMPCTSFEHTAVDLKDGSTAVWTDGLSLNSDNDRHCHYRLEGGQKYKVVVYKA